MGDNQFVSTGAAAKLLGVTPDTVLKWIKRGRLEASRTPGGHYRVSRVTLGRMSGEQQPAAPESTPAAAPAAPAPVYCWEYHAVDGHVRPACTDCRAYQAKALRCYELRSLPSGMGSPADFCTTACEVCGYFREQVQGPVRVLVVSDSVSLREELLRGAAHRPIRLEFASREYECASIVEAFHPEFALIDCSLPKARWTSLVACMVEDRRAAGTRVLLLARRRAKRWPSALEAINRSGPVHLGLPLSWPQFESALGLRPAPLPPITSREPNSTAG